MDQVFDDQRVTLSLGDVLTNGFAIGLKNALSLIGASILWILTIWIPYLNVGTTIGLFTMPVAMSKGKIVSPTEIFDGKYRQYMGEFFLLLGLRSLMTIPGYLFMYIPGIVMSLTYSMGVYIVLDKHIEPSKALSMSNKMTYGNKWTIFLSRLSVYAPFLLFGLILRVAPSLFGVVGFLIFIYMIVMIPIMLGIDAYIYSQLSKAELVE
jgi:uncharacterized membrane protein